MYVEITDARREKKDESKGGVRPCPGGIFFRSTAVVGLLGKKS